MIFRSCCQDTQWGRASLWADRVWYSGLHSMHEGDEDDGGISWLLPQCRRPVLDGQSVWCNWRWCFKVRPFTLNLNRQCIIKTTRYIRTSMH